MRISLHGGNCCGIKHIHDLGRYPTVLKCAARKPRKMTSFGQSETSGTNDMIHRNVRGKCDFFNEAAPQELYEDRFDRFVKFIKDKRPNGIIEVVINPSQKAWEPILKKHNFKKVSSGTNSNTYGTIIVYHLVY